MPRVSRLSLALVIFTPKRIVVAPANPRISPLHYYAAPTNSPRPLARKNRAASKRFLEFALYMSEARKSFGESTSLPIKPQLKLGIDSAIVGEVRYRFETGFYEGMILIAISRSSSEYR